jgi:hypothetical protein
MTTNTPVPAQRDAVLTDEEITNVLRRLAVRPGDHDFNLGQCIARAIESALLSKLRAPVADERAAFARAEISFPMTIPGNRVYLAGPMTGHENHNFPAFHAAAERLRASGLEVVNPADHGLVDSLGWADYMRWDLVKLAGCHSVYVLPGWEKSKGAGLEVSIAQALGMPVLTVDGAALASAPVAGEAQRLDAPAQVGGTRFGKGIHWSTVIHAAQRHHEYMQDPAREAERIAQAKKFQALVAGDAAPQASEAGKGQQ